MVKHGIISTNFKAFAGVDTMDEFIKELDPNLDYLEHKIIGNEVIIYAASNRKICRCPYCGSESARIHSRYEKVFRIFQSWAKKQKSLLKTENSSATIQTVDSLLLQSVSTSCHRKGKRQNA